jgi:hypothetical protein
MSDKNEEDILKRLRSVRKRLQESLDDDSGKTVERGPEQNSAPAKIELIDSQREIEREDKRKVAAAGGKKPAKSGPRLHSTPADHKTKVSSKEFKAKSGGVSRKRMAAMQRRIKAKVESRKGLSKKKKIWMGIVAALLTLPLLFVTTLSLATCRFDFDNIGIEYRDRPGEIMLTLPVYNPSFVPAQLGDLEFDLLAKHKVDGVDTYYEVSRIHTSYGKDIAPYTTVVIDINIDLDPDTAGGWLRDLFNTFTLELTIRDFKYNNMRLPGDISLPAFDLSSMVEDLTSGLDLDSLMGDGLALSQPSASNVKDLWDMAGKPTSPDAALEKLNNPQAAATEEAPSFELLDIGLGEDSEKFQLKLDAAFYLDPLDGFYLGPIRIMDLNVTLYGPGGVGASADTTSRDYYRNPIASLSTWDLSKENVTDFSWAGLARNKSYPLEINFGAVSYAAARLTVYKDNLQGKTTHPSAYLNFSDAASLAAFETANMTSYPTWYFLNNLLAHQMIDCLLRIEKLSIEIFGIQIKDISIDEKYLPILKTSKPLFDFDDLIGGMMTQPTGIMAGFKYFTQSVSTMGMAPLGLAPNIPSPAQPSLEIDDLGDMLGDINTDDLLDSIQESWGEDANLSLGLGLNIDNTLLDLHVGLYNLSLGISNVITNDQFKEEERIFCYATATNGEGGPDVYLNGLNSTMLLNLNLTLMKNEEFAPHVEKFLRDLLESFELVGTAILNMDYLILFAENYTFAGIKLALGLDALGLDLEDMIVDLLRDLIEEDLMDMILDMGASEEEGISFNNPLTAPIELMAMLLFANPIMAPMTQMALPNMQLVSKDGKKKTAFTPQAAQDEEFVEITVTEFGSKTTIDVFVPGLSIGEGTIPVHLGLGKSYLEIQTNSSNTYGEWTPLIGLTVNEYVALGPLTDKIDLDLSLTIYETDTLCAVMDAATSGRTDPTFSLRIAGDLTLNVSNVYVPNIDLALEIPDLTLSLDMQGILDGLMGSMEAAEPGANVIGPHRAAVADEIIWWDGDFSKLPLNAQEINIEDFFEIGGFEILGLKETGWPHVDQGEVILDIVIPLENHLMELELIDPKILIYSDKNTLLANMSILNEDIALKQDTPLDLTIRMTLYKSLELQNWINEVLYTLNIPGTIYADLSIKVFGCTIGPLIINGSTNDLLSTLGFDIASLLGAMIPLNERTLRDSPLASQDVMDLLGNFGIAYITTKRDGELVSSIQPVGPLNYTDPMFSAVVGLVLQPAFNMSILDADLYLCDGNVYDRIYEASNNDSKEAITYSKIAQITMDPFPVYCNTSYAPNTNFTTLATRGELPDGLNSSSYNSFIDPNKPYYDQDKLNTGTTGLHYAQNYNSTDGEIYKSYGLGSFAMTDLMLNLYNISHGTYQTSYPKKYWRAMGGPYFPVQVFDKYHGGYPDHRYVYHPHFSPLANLFAGVGDLMSGGLDGLDPMALLEDVAFGGNITVNVFSMNITLDASSPAVSTLISSLVGETETLIMDQYKAMVNPVWGRQDPKYAYADRVTRVSKYEDPTIPRFATAPLRSEFYTDMELDMEAFINNYPIMGLEPRNDHTFAPSQHGLGPGGQIYYMNDSRDMGSSINPWKWDMTVRSDYKPGLAEYGGDNRENFVKDPYYEEYKLVVQNWADSYNKDNPFFESINLSTYEGPTISNGYVESFELIEDPKNWPLKWVSATDPNEPSFTGQRLPSFAAIYMQGLIPAFELTLISAIGQAWNEDPAPGKDCSQLMPIGYIWANNSVSPPTQGDKDDGFYKTNNVQVADGGVFALNSSWVMLNLRLFDSAGTRAFITGLADVLDMNLHFYLDINLNASMFGYELYGLGLSKLNLGGYSPYETRCADDLSQGQTGSVWGVPSANGTIVPPSDTYASSGTWIPKDFLPKFDSETTALDTSSLMDGFSDMDLLSTITGGLGLDGGGISLTMDLPILSPITLPAWITVLEGTIVANYDQDIFTECDNYKWEVLIALGALGDIWTELNNYWDESTPGGLNTQPYNIAGDGMGWYPAEAGELAGQQEIQTDELIILPSLEIYLEMEVIFDLISHVIGGSFLSFAWDLIMALINGDPLYTLFPDYLWITILKDRFELFRLEDGNPYTNPVGGLIHAILPPALGYDYAIEITYDQLTLNLFGLLGDTLGAPEGYFHADEFHEDGYRNYYYAGSRDPSEAVANRTADSSKGEFDIGRNYYSHSFWLWLHDQPDSVKEDYGYYEINKREGFISGDLF